MKRAKYGAVSSVEPGDIVLYMNDMALNRQPSCDCVGRAQSWWSRQIAPGFLIDKI
jgi:hypothetical protein